MILRLHIFEDHIAIDCEYRVMCSGITDDIERICRDTGCTFDNDTWCITGQKSKLYEFVYCISGWYDCFIE